jgi:hypothetical protein
MEGSRCIFQQKPEGELRPAIGYVEGLLMPGVRAVVPLILLAKRVSLGMLVMPAVLSLLLLGGLMEKIFVEVLRRDFGWRCYWPWQFSCSYLQWRRSS